MFGIGDTELLLILLFAFLLFGPDKLPGMGRTIGRGIRQFRQASDSVTKVVKSEVLDPLSQAANEDGITRSESSDAASQAVAAKSENESHAPARSQETFAERRARLAKEKAAREEQERQEAALLGQEVATTGESLTSDPQGAQESASASVPNKALQAVHALELDAAGLPNAGDADAPFIGATSQASQTPDDASAAAQAVPTVASMWGLSEPSSAVPVTAGTGEEGATDKPA